MSDSKDLIVKTAFNLFISKSYNEVTMQDIVKATGLSKGGFYHYFSSKEKVFEAVVNVFIQRTKVEELAAFSEGTLKEFYSAYIDVLEKRIMKYREESGASKEVLKANHYALVFDAIKLLDGFKERQTQIHEEELELWKTVIAKAKASGEIATPLTDEQMAKLFLFQNYGIGVYYFSRSQADEALEQMKEQFQAIYKSISKD
ncbi:TetR/AcrR family transcriptional regulator [Mangrovimonas xylaniphaga]|uniref:TetR/AcrR family transcriptional regulator n=1 Tax=Mangrovimonas xylaniphaga TaxID=1645915 RepID=UPI0006B610C4|nr:TetR/AcrR family transcriptional regulator [Mangrovimonas xylaniphaga]